MGRMIAFFNLIYRQDAKNAKLREFSLSELGVLGVLAVQRVWIMIE
jgi:hypothetical protein